MFSLPSDIENKINQLFNSSEDNQDIKKLISGLWQRSLNVGPAQLARSILTVSGGDIEKLKDIFQREFYGDPRDIILLAEKQAGNPGHYFIPSFDEMENGTC